MKNYFLSFVVVTMGFLMACGAGESTENTANIKGTTGVANEKATADYDLSSNEIPVIVTGPAGAEVKRGMGNAEIDGIRTINYELVKDMFKLDVTYTSGAEYDKAELLSNAKQYATEEEGFVEFVSEEELGFIYKLKTEDGEDYSFYYLLLKEAQPIEFSTGFSLSTYNLEQVQALFEAAKTAK